MGHRGLQIFITEALTFRGEKCLKNTIERQAPDACTWPSFLSQANEPRKQETIFRVLGRHCFPG